ncbi:slipin family protein [Balneolaceae bacterium YR4-1]|uniref:Slipin family protein n=1 Tax=Halalkalibaculum roseum TaxID=2709311 RepID=A0A6M1SRB3_9BACT|nr:slipin family protein [Halalkalibaculum roseum]NGP77951.1 slipin family protein [Halalkalibaculum roseum]
MENGEGLVNSLTWIITIAVLAAILLPQMFKILREYERAVVFRLGKFQKTKGPGLIFLIPFIDKIERVDLRVLTINVDKQEVITKDNVTVNVDAITFFRVIDAEQAVIQVEQYIHATSMLAQTTLRSIVGQVELDELLAEREKVNKNIQEIIDRQTDPWGIKVVSVEVRDVVLPENMKRAMARQAETERDRRAKVINAEGEYQAAERLVDAAKMIQTAPAALQLRFLQTMNDVAEENTSFVFMPIPLDFIDAFRGLGGDKPIISPSAKSKGDGGGEEEN